jgi:ribose 5-phosphate isomerase B
MRKIYIGADSAGYALKEELKKELTGNGYEVVDCGPGSDASCHYPIFAAKVCEAVKAELDSSFGILICGTGIGMSMCANKFHGIRAALCSDTFSAKMTRVHNNANVLCMGARVIGSCLASEIMNAFLSSEFEDGGRHRTRVDMMMEIEKNQ